MVLSQPSCWLPGCGLGNFHFAILPAYRAEPSAWFYHAENLYIELLAEMGIVGFVIGLIGLIWLILRIRWCVVTGRRGAPTFIATTLAVAAVALQSLVDFSLIIPSVFIPLAALVGCFLARTYSPEFGKKSGRSDQRKKAQRGSDQRTEKELPSNSLWSGIPTSIALLSLVLFSIWIGSQPLQGFAFAEQLNSEIGDLQQPSSESAVVILRKLSSLPSEEKAALALPVTQKSTSRLAGYCRSLRLSNLKLNCPGPVT